MDVPQAPISQSIEKRLTEIENTLLSILLLLDKSPDARQQAGAQVILKEIAAAQKNRRAKGE